MDKLLNRSAVLKIMLPISLPVLYCFSPGVEFLKLSSIEEHLIYFILGRYLREWRGASAFSLTLKNPVKMLLTAVFSLLWLFFVWLDVSWLSVITALLGTAALVLFAQYSWVNNIFGRFGPYTLQLYLLNGYSLVLSRTITVIILKITSPVIIISFNVFVDLILTYLFIKYICAKIRPVRVLMGMN